MSNVKEQYVFSKVHYQKRSFFSTELKFGRMNEHFPYSNTYANLFWTNMDVAEENHKTDYVTHHIYKQNVN